MFASADGGARPRSLSVGATLLTVVVALVASQLLAGLAMAVGVAALMISGRLPASSPRSPRLIHDLMRDPLTLSLTTCVIGATIVTTGAIALRIIRAPFRATTALRGARPLHAALGVVLVLACGPFADLAASAFQEAFPRWTFGVLDTLQ